MNGNGSTAPCEEHGAAAPAEDLASCPACGSLIPRAALEKILHLDQARERLVAAERAALEQERKSVGTERDAIVKAATTAERARWRIEADRITRVIDEAKVHAETARKALETRHRKEMELLIKRRAAHEVQVAKQLAMLKKKAGDEAVRASREARREALGEQSELIDMLRKELKTSEERRQRDEIAMKREIADLARKADGRDRKHFGVEGEVDLIQALRTQFPGDRIEHFGERGDALQTVVDDGREIGRLLFESKNTSSWASKFVADTEEAMLARDARFGLLVSRTLPRGNAGVAVLGAVIVIAPALVGPVVAILRESMISLARMRGSERDKTVIEARVLAYLRSEEFVLALQRVATKVEELRENLAREKSSHDSIWRGREERYAAIARESSGVDARIKDLLMGALTGGGAKAVRGDRNDGV